MSRTNKAMQQKEQAKQLLRNKGSNWGEVNTLLQQSVSNNAKDPEAQFLLGLSFYSLRNYAGALEHLHAGYQLDPGNIQALLVEANVYRDMGQPDKAESAYRTVIKQAPDYAQAYFNLSQLLDNQGRRQDALVLLEQGAAKANPSADVFTALGDHYLETKRPDEAKASFEQALKIDPNYALAKAGLNKIK